MSPAADLESSGRRGAERFPPTHWSIVLAAAQEGSPHAQEALAKLCAIYWFPLYAFVRRRGHAPAEAEDMTQGFFAQLIEKKLLCGLKHEDGKFRSFLLTTFKCFLANVWKREHAQKRGGGKVIVSMDDAAEARYQRELVEHATPETLFERQWAWTVLDRVLGRLRDEHTAAGKPELFARLRTFLPGAEGRASYPEVAASLQMNEPAVRMAVHRLRRRYGELLRAEIAATVSKPEEIDEEIQHLIKVIGQNGV